MGVVNKILLSYNKIPGTLVLKNSGNPGSVVAQGPRFPGEVGVVVQLPSMGEAWIFPETAPTADILKEIFDHIPLFSLSKKNAALGQKLR